MTDVLAINRELDVLAGALEMADTAGNAGLIGVAAYIEALAAEIRSLRADRERLEWLIQDPAVFMQHDGNHLIVKADIDAARGASEATEEAKGDGVA